MTPEPLPSKYVRHGGDVATFDDPRLAYKQVADERVATLLVPPETRVVYPAAPSRSWNNEHLRVEQAIVDSIEGDETRAENGMETGFWYEEGERVTPDEFDDSVDEVSAAGIHVFATYKGAAHW